MVLLYWIGLFALSLLTLVQGSSLVVKSAERIGIYFGLPSFVIGVLIVGLGTSLPELASGLAAVFSGQESIVAANAIGSNIANMLLAAGIFAVLARRVVIKENLIDAELPFFVISTVLFLGVAIDGTIMLIESLLLFITYTIYLGYLLSDHHSEDTLVSETSSEVHEKRKRVGMPEPRYFLFFALGLVAVIFGARYVVISVTELALFFDISAGVLSAILIAFGTSLPEITVSITAFLERKTSIAIGNVFGSNAFNILVAVGVPGLFGTLTLDTAMRVIGLPALLGVSVIFLVIGLSRKLYRWEGFLFLILYTFFVLELIESAML